MVLLFDRLCSHNGLHFQSKLNSKALAHLPQFYYNFCSSWITEVPTNLSIAWASIQRSPFSTQATKSSKRWPLLKTAVICMLWLPYIKSKVLLCSQNYQQQVSKKKSTHFSQEPSSLVTFSFVTRKLAGISSKQKAVIVSIQQDLKPVSKHCVSRLHGGGGYSSPLAGQPYGTDLLATFIQWLQT